MSAESEARVAASEFRRDHELGHGALDGDLISIIEQATGIDVAVLPVTDADEHGLTMRDPRTGRVFIGVAASDRPMRQRSTIAHEVCHVIFEDWGLTSPPDGRPSHEIRADAFARHLLIPVEGVRAFVADRHGAGHLSLCSEVVQHFLVSPQVAAIAMCEAGVIDQAGKSALMTVSTPALATRFGWMDFYRELQSAAKRTRAPQRLLARATAGYVEGVVSKRTIATLRGVGIEDVESELGDAGVFPPSDEASGDVHISAFVGARNDAEWVALLDGLADG